jgi:GNAT superfamily N-acetyltransferase
VNVKLAETDEEIRACFPVMAELRPQVPPEAFLERVRAQGRQGYRLAFLADGGAPVAVAGFRVLENLAWGRFLYVDDLVTLASSRSRGYGAALLAWLRETARREGCGELHLDSGTQRRDAHRFYEREGLVLSAYHFRWGLEA